MATDSLPLIARFRLALESVEASIGKYSTPRDNGDRAISDDFCDRVNEQWRDADLLRVEVYSTLILPHWRIVKDNGKQCDPRPLPPGLDICDTVPSVGGDEHVLIRGPGGADDRVWAIIVGLRSVFGSIDSHRANNGGRRFHPLSRDSMIFTKEHSEQLRMTIAAAGELQVPLTARVREASPADPADGPVLDPNHEAILCEAVWSQERVDRFNAADAPIDSARQWLEGHEFRLSEADRHRHHAGATRESYSRMLKWADDPKYDRQREALDVLLDRIRQHPRPPYSPEVLLNEYDRLIEMPVHARLGNDFAGRFRAWLDRVETFLSIGASARRDDDKTKATDDDTPFPFGDEHLTILVELAALNRLVKASELDGRSGMPAYDTLVDRLGEMESATPKLVERPSGPRRGYQVTIAAREELNRRGLIDQPT